MSDPLIGKTLCGYRVEKLLARGDDRSVYRATQLCVDRPVALKILSLSAGRERTLLRSFLEEARSAGRLKHPGLVDHHEVRQYGDLIFSSMEYLPGGTLEDLVEREGPLPWPRFLCVLQPAVAALAWMESQGATHGRLHPRRILLAQDGRWKLLHGGAPARNPRRGDAAYLAPERIRGAAPDSRSDVYALGCICYYALSGKRPAGNGAPASAGRKRAGRAPLSRIRPDLPKQVVRLVERMMAPRPERRFRNFAEVAGHLETLCNRLGGAANERGPGSSSLPRLRAPAMVERASSAPSKTSRASLLMSRIGLKNSADRAPEASTIKPIGTCHAQENVRTRNATVKATGVTPCSLHWTCSPRRTLTANTASLL